MAKGKGFAAEFKKFIMRGNVIDMAVGIIIGGAFSPIVNSLVKDIIMPPIGFVMNNVDFSNLYLSLTPTAEQYATVAEAQEAGLVTINYGIFINTLISFLIVSFAVFLLVKAINKLKDKIEVNLINSNNLSYNNNINILPSEYYLAT